MNKSTLKNRFFREWLKIKPKNYEEWSRILDVLWFQASVQVGAFPKLTIKYKSKFASTHFVEFSVIVLIKPFERLFSGLLIRAASIYGFTCRQKNGILHESAWAKILWIKLVMASLGFWEQGNEITYFKGTRDNFRINLREQAIFLQFKGTLTKYFREQWNILPGKRLSLFIVVNAVIKCIIVCLTM